MKKTIKYIYRKELDIKKYDACIDRSTNGLVYALSWFLDTTADDWGALVLGNYQLVMPIPYLKLKRHLFIKKIYQPDFCQQLGVFGENVTKQLMGDFFDAFLLLNPKNYNFNHDNTIFLKKSSLHKRINITLDLTNSYIQLAENYSKNRKRNLKKSKKEELIIKQDISSKSFVNFKIANTNYKTSTQQNKKMQFLIDEAIKRNLGVIYGVYLSEQLVSASFFINYKSRLLNLIAVSNKAGKNIAASSFLFDMLIRENANSNTIFDFEGSMQEGIARFYKSFGAKESNYLSLGQ